MRLNRFAVNLIQVVLGLALLAVVALFSFGKDARAALGSPSLFTDFASIDQPDAQSSLLSTADSQQTNLDHRLFLPAIANQYPQLELGIFDGAGNPQSWNWLIERFGAVWLHRDSGGASVRVLREEASGQTVLIVSVHRDGLPVQNVPVMFYWPDAPWLAPELKACSLDRALVVYTNSSGEAHFAMGGGSAYWPPAGGPHIVWVGGPGSDCLGGLGWLGGTNHVHLNSEWQLP